MPNLPFSIKDATPAGDPGATLSNAELGGMNPGGANAPGIGIGTDAGGYAENPFSSPADTVTFKSSIIGGSLTDANATSVNAAGVTALLTVDYANADYNDTVSPNTAAAVIAPDAAEDSITNRGTDDIEIGESYHGTTAV